MLHLYDAATRAAALAGDLPPALRRLLLTRLQSMGEELVNQTELVVVQPGDTEEDIERAIGFSPLIEPIDGIRYPAFQQGGWDWIVDHGGHWEMQFTFGSTFAYLVIVEDADVLRDHTATFEAEDGVYDGLWRSLPDGSFAPLVTLNEPHGD